MHVCGRNLSSLPNRLMLADVCRLVAANFNILNHQQNHRQRQLSTNVVVNSLKFAWYVLGPNIDATRDGMAGYAFFLGQT